MKIVNRKPQGAINESVMETADRLFESYSKSRNMNDFLAENGKSDDNIAIYNYMSLNEAVADDSKRLIFENGMYIPNTNVKSTGRLSLRTLAEQASTCEEFILSVSTEICESKLGFTPTENDIKTLLESYNTYKNSQSLND